MFFPLSKCYFSSLQMEKYHISNEKVFFFFLKIYLSSEINKSREQNIPKILHIWPKTKHLGTDQTDKAWAPPSSCGHWASLGAGAAVKCAGGSFPARGQTRPGCSVWWRSGDGPCPGSCPPGWARWWIPAAGGSNTPSPRRNVPVSLPVTACAVWGWTWLKMGGRGFGKSN